MKNILIIVLTLFLYNNVFSQGIAFEHVTYAEALVKAKENGKMVFMDCYTSWCGPCKMLAKDIFPQKEVGDYFNANYVCIKMDMEKGEGIELRKKYDVKAFPTLLFMDADGEVLHTVVGAPKAEVLISEATKAGDPSQRIGALTERYVKGDRDVKFVLKYLKVLELALKDNELREVSNEFITNTPVTDMYNKDAFAILALGDVKYKGEVYSYLLTNKEKFMELVGQSDYNMVIFKSIMNHLNAVVKTGTLDELKSEIENCSKDFVFEDQEYIELELYSNYYLEHKEFNDWFDCNVKFADEILKKDKATGSFLYFNMAYRMISDSIFEDTGIYERMIKTIVEVKSLDEGFLPFYYCLANLYKETGHKAKALDNINLYIRKSAEQGDERDEEIEQLKRDIESM